MSTPAGDTGGQTSTPVDAELAALPAKVRVHALAKLLGSSSRDVMRALEELGEPARSAQSSVVKQTAQQVARMLLGAETGSATPEPAAAPEPASAPAPAESAEPQQAPQSAGPLFTSASPLFLPPTEVVAAPPRRPEPEPAPDDQDDESGDAEDQGDDGDADGDTDADSDARRRRRRGRRGRGRGKGTGEDGAEDGPDGGDGEQQPVRSGGKAAAKADGAADKPDKAEKPEKREQPEGKDADADADDAEDGSRRRRRRRRRKSGGDGDGDASGTDDPPNTVVHVRDSRDGKPERDGKSDRDEVRSVRGSTRLEAKRQRRRDGREAGRRRAPILSEAEFLARREAVDRTMVVREQPDRTQIAVLEDGVLVEHFVTSSSTGSMVGNVYLGRVQNVLPSMEAAFVDIGRGRNAVLYAGEVDWDAAGLEGKARRIEQALSTGDSVLVQVTKDPVGHKGARLTTQISLPGRFLVYVPGGGATGISRKLPENERRRLKDVLKRIVPEDAGVIIRTASEGVSEDELGRDVRRLQAQWQVIKDKSDADAGKGKKSSAPTLLYEEPDLLVKVVRDLFTEDFSALVVQGPDAWDTIDAYVRHVAPELAERVRRHVGAKDVFAEHRVDEQLLKALDRKVWLPSGGYLVIDRTEAMTVIDVNTGKFTGSGGNLEETVTRNNLESAEEIVRQLRLRDIGGIIVIDFIDMVLESNRDLVLRRLTECLGRDRTRHQVAEVTSLGLVQMTRKRVGTGLLEAFSTPCEHCKGRGVMVSTELDTKSGNGSHGQSHGHQSGHGSSGGKREHTGRGSDTRDGRDTRDGKDGNKDGNKDGRNSRRAAAAAEDHKDTAAAPAPEVAAVDPVPPVADPVVEPAAEPVTEPVAVEPEPESAAWPVAGAEHAVPAVDEVGVVEDVEPAPARRSRSRRAGRAARPAGAPASITPPQSNGEVPPVPESNSYAVAAAVDPVELAVTGNGHSAQLPADLVDPAAAPAQVPAQPNGAAEPSGVVRRRQPRRAASRPAGPPVGLPDSTDAAEPAAVPDPTG